MNMPHSEAATASRDVQPFMAARKAYLGRRAIGLGIALAVAGMAVSTRLHAADAPVSSPAVPQRPAAAAPGDAHKPAAKSRGQRLQAICSAADLNHDGTVSLDEFHQDIVQSWHSLGPDAAGYVNLAQLAQVPRIGKGRLKRLAASDKDGDGKLSFKEVVETRMAYFEAADTNQNDELSIQECVTYERQRRAGKQ
ncbi:EF-hand domain-containing protein [Acidovorax sp. sic0104]|uniref:EF-hand domain-containing protein n=1 Tax=Acidovorax sp. sic0104 TaxID=2854784 RepID=UPI002105C4BD|nr:EF-hand domain-containing protein [Acidovorax sp. sic0104]